MHGRVHEIRYEIDVDRFRWFEWLPSDVNTSANLKHLCYRYIRLINRNSVLHAAVQQIPGTNPNPRHLAPKCCTHWCNCCSWWMCKEWCPNTRSAVENIGNGRIKTKDTWEMLTIFASTLGQNSLAKCSNSFINRQPCMSTSPVWKANSA